LPAMQAPCWCTRTTDVSITAWPHHGLRTGRP
jgi:hypothetical protein